MWKTTLDSGTEQQIYLNKKHRMELKTQLITPGQVGQVLHLTALHYSLDNW